MSRIGYYNISSSSDGPMARPGAVSRDSVMASFYFEQDISFLFPYINAVAKESELHEQVTYPVVDDGGHQVSSVTLHVDTQAVVWATRHGII